MEYAFFVLHVNLALFYSQLHAQSFYHMVADCNCEVFIAENPCQHAYLT